MFSNLTSWHGDRLRVGEALASLLLGRPAFAETLRAGRLKSPLPPILQPRTEDRKEVVLSIEKRQN